MACGFVPQATGHRDCSIVLPRLDGALTDARRALLASQSQTDSLSISAAWAAFEETAICVDGVYRCLDTLVATVDADMSEPRSTTSAYVNHVMSADSHPLAVAFGGLVKCADRLPMLVKPARHRYEDFSWAVKVTTAAMADVMREVRSHSPEFVKPFLTCQRMTASSWREHGFKSLESCDSHAFLEIPASTRNHLMTTVGARWSVHQGTHLMESGWDQVGLMPTGVRLGSVVRYVSNKQERAPLMLFEQLLVREVNSLFDKQLYTRLRAQLHDMPNAQLPSDHRIPLLAIMYSVRTQPPNADLDLLAEFTDTAALTAAVKARLDELSDGLVSTRDERTGYDVCRIGYFLGMSALWFSLAERLQLGDTAALDRQATGWPEAKRSLYYIMRALVSLRERQQELKLAVRVLWWTRYTRRDRADEGNYWLYQLDSVRLVDDLKAFSVSSGFWSGSATWTFTPDKMNA